MNGNKVYEVECLQSTDPIEHSQQLAYYLCDGWEIITDGLLTTYIGDENKLQLIWYATLKRQIKPGRMATTEFERSLLELAEGDPLDERVREEASELLSADDPYQRAIIANEIAENMQVSSMVLMLLAEAVIPVIDNDYNPYLLSGAELERMERFRQ